MRIHPLADLYPAMTEDEFKSLTSDIHQNGLRQPILLHPDGSILDGRHRWRAIDDLADQGVIVEPHFMEWDKRGDLVSLIHSLNFHRRHLSVSQKACIGVGYKRELQETVRQGQRTDLTYGNNSISSGQPVRDIAAAKVGVSGKVVDIAERISEVAPDLFVRIGDSPAFGKEYTLWDAQRELKRRQRKEKEADAIASAPSLTSSVRLFTGETSVILRECFSAGLQVPLIATDPPYNMGKAEWDEIADYPSFCQEWIEAATAILAPGGSFYVFGTYASLHDVYAAANACGLSFLTEIVWDYLNGAGGKWPRRHDLCLYFVKTGAEPTFNREAVQVQRHEAHIREYRGHTYNVKTPGTVWRFPTVDAQSVERTTHPTQKPVPLMERIILASSLPGEIVLDPFAGSGSTLVAALRHGRQAVGIERDPHYCDIIRARCAAEKVSS